MYLAGYIGTGIVKSALFNIKRKMYLVEYIGTAIVNTALFYIDENVPCSVYR